MERFNHNTVARGCAQKYLASSPRHICSIKKRVFLAYKQRLANACANASLNIAQVWKVLGKMLEDDWNCCHLLGKYGSDCSSIPFNVRFAITIYWSSAVRFYGFCAEANIYGNSNVECRCEYVDLCKAISNRLKCVKPATNFSCGIFWPHSQPKTFDTHTQTLTAAHTFSHMTGIPIKLANRKYEPKYHHETVG